MKEKLIIKSDANYIIKEIIKKHTSRKFYRYLKNHNYILLVNNIERRNHEKIFEGDILTIIYDKIGVSDQNRQQIDLDIVYEDDFLMVINKPFDLQTIPSRKDNKNSLYNALIYYFVENNKTNTIHFINRLDKPTQGLLLVAKDKYSALKLTNDLKNINRYYLALVKEILCTKEGKIETFIKKDDITGKRIANLESGQKAITYYKVIKEDKDSLIELKLETGRTHQIRCHMKYIGHEIIGDDMYSNDDGYLKLCSYKIDFIHPVTNEQMKFEIKPKWQ